MPPSAFRQIVRAGKWQRGTEMVCRGYAQANLAIVPKDVALDFFTFCFRKKIGIKDLYDPDMGRSASIEGPIPPQEPDEIPLFWGCGVTPQAAAIAAKPSLMITHFPGAMFITDKLSNDLAIF